MPRNSAVATCLWLVLCLICCTINVDANRKLSIILKRYQNPSHRKWSGACCAVGWGRCSTCSTLFKVCIQEGEPPPSSGRGQCPSGWQQVLDDLYGGDDIKMHYALTYPVKSLKSDFVVVVESWNRDPFQLDPDPFQPTQNNLIDRFCHNVKALSYLRGQTVTLKGKRAVLFIKFKVSCATGFYGKRCNCQFTHNKRGHHTCDRNGRKICLPGWYGKNCTKYCNSSSMTNSSNFTCDRNGNKICKRAWFGPHCTKYCSPARGRFKCDINGNKLCLRGWSSPLCESCASGWYGKNCSKYCVPKPERYQCNAQGERVCVRGWYGRTCSKYCKPTKRHYKCAKGRRVCLPGWFRSTECHKYCSPWKKRRTGHFSCDKDGNEICSPGWHGSKCFTYCVTRDDSVNGHYSCDVSGNKICLSGWHGPKCLLKVLRSTEQ